MRIFNVVPFAIRGPRAALIALFLLSVAPPFLYYRAVAPELDSARLTTGLLPGVYVLLRVFGFFSLFVAGFVALATALAF
jgi:hypothetical protein